MIIFFSKLKNFKIIFNLKGGSQAGKTLNEYPQNLYRPYSFAVQALFDVFLFTIKVTISMRKHSENTFISLLVTYDESVEFLTKDLYLLFFHYAYERNLLISMWEVNRNIKYTSLL